MNSTRLLGPPPALKVVAVVVLVGALVGVLVEKGLTSLAFAALAVVIAWRLFGLSVSLDGWTLVVRNVLRTHRFAVDEIDVRARVVDPRREFYSPGIPEAFPEIPTASDDNTPQAAKWYELVRGKDRYSIDALMARRPAQHEHLAWELRQEILAAREIGRAAG